jgi:hypothetical protein
VDAAAEDYLQIEWDHLLLAWVYPSN